MSAGKFSISQVRDIVGEADFLHACENPIDSCLHPSCEGPLGGSENPPIQVSHGDNDGVVLITARAEH